MSNKSLLIVESPTKVKTIKQYVSNDYEILSCVGHVKDLPKNNLGIDIENDFKIELSVLPEKKKFISELRKKAKVSKHIFIATDPDREGEAIASHLASEIPKETEIREGKAFNLFCYTLIFGTVIFQYLNNRFDWSDLILPLILLISILLPRLQLLKD